MSITNQQEEIAALGRPFDLGMLYDIRRDKLIIGKTLWSQEQLKSQLNTVYCRQTKTEIVRGSRISEQFLPVEVDGRLKLNVLCNNVDIQGSAAYLKDDKYSKGQVQVVLQYQTKTQLRHLTMEHLEDTKISHPDVLDESSATHVVVGIQYGGKVRMKFVQEVTKEESSEKLERKLKACIEKLKSLVALGMNADVNGTTHGTTQTETIKCEVRSDFPAEKYPSTYEEAILFCKNLPSLTGSDKIGIPVIVYLRSLKSLGCTLRENRLEARKQISDELDNKACVNIEYLLSVLAECQDLIEEDNFPTLKERLKLFVQMVQEYTAFFQRKISQLIDTLAGNDDFDAFLQEQESSTFSRAKLTKWLDEMKEKMKTLQGIMKCLDGIEIVSKGKLNSFLCRPLIPHVVCFAFEISDQDAQLSNMQAFLQKGPMQKSEETDVSLDLGLVHKALRRFMELAEDNKHNRTTTFVAMEEPLSSMGSGEKSGAYVRYYYEGNRKDENLMPREEPQNLRAVYISHNSVKLVWDNSPAQLNGVKDKVQYKTDHDEWQTSAECTGRKATILGLQPGTKYTFRVHAPDQIFLRENRELVVETEPGFFPINLTDVTTVDKLFSIGLFSMCVLIAGLFSWKR